MREISHSCETLLSNSVWTSGLITRILTVSCPTDTTQRVQILNSLVNKMKTVALLLSAINIEAFLCQYLDCEYFKNYTSDLYICRCQDHDQDNLPDNTSLKVPKEETNKSRGIHLLVTLPFNPHFRISIK